MIRTALSAAVCLTWAAMGLYGQGANPSTVVGAGYLVPGPIFLAPGEVITIFGIGVGSTLTQPVFAGTGKLPTSLAGISVTIAQETNLPAPILVVSPAPRCANCPVLTAITIQVPYELYQPPAGGGVSSGIVQSVDLFVTENGVAGNWTIVFPWPDQIHILRAHDTVFGGSVPTNDAGSWELTHVDGTLVSNANPAAAGEELIAYAVGLGATNPAVPTGQPATQPTPTAATFRLGFNFQANALPAAPPFSQASPAATPLFTGLTPGYPGLYQINFVVPPVPAGLPPCASGQGPAPSLVSTNLTVSVGGSTFDGAGICVLLPE
jgi:uncharacterized protein (TIGR03437 family)